MGSTFNFLHSNKQDAVNRETKVESQPKEDLGNEQVVPNIPRSEPLPIPVKKKKTEMVYMANSPYEAYQIKKRQKGAQFLFSSGNKTPKKEEKQQEDVSRRFGLDLNRNISFKMA